MRERAVECGRVQWRAGGCGSVQNVRECTRMYASALDCAGAYGSVRSVQEYTGVL